MPVGKVETCAKAILNSACRGERYLTEPAWFKVTNWWKVFFPEVVEYTNMLLYMSSPGKPPEDALGKKILDYTGCQKIIYPETIIDDHGPKTN